MLNPLQSSLLPPSTQGSSCLRVATYNIHKGVRGMGPSKRLEIHNLGLAVEALDADIVCLQEVRRFNEQEARTFSRTQFGPMAWPAEPQADYLAPEGYEVAYRTNAFTRGGEHGNALLARWPRLAQRAAQVQRLVDEARWGFGAHIELFEALQQRCGATTRSA